MFSEEVVILTKILNFWRSVGKRPVHSIHDNMQPTVISRDKHNISRKNISNNALKVLSRLNGAGYDAYLVGGSVRDLLLGLKPKDFDIATNATPEQVKQLFKNCRLIGRRFRLAHVLFGRDIIEVATFRGHHKPEHQIKNQSEAGMLLRDNVYGTIEEDVLRRDFKVNALYYSIKDFSIIDFVGGMHDLYERKLHLIGNTEVRYREDPVRMLRAVRLSTKLDLSIDSDSRRLIPELADLLNNVPKARLWDESLKLFLSGHAVAVNDQLQRLQLYSRLFPLTAQLMDSGDEEQDKFIALALSNTDKRIHIGRPVTPAFLYAALLWHPFQKRLAQEHPNERENYQIFVNVANDIINEQNAYVTIPRRFSIIIKEIWTLQLRLPRRFGKRAEKLLTHPRFRAAYDFLLLREESGAALNQLGEWWTKYQDADEKEQRDMIRSLDDKPKKRRRSRNKHRSPTTSEKKNKP